MDYLLKLYPIEPFAGMKWSQCKWCQCHYRIPDTYFAEILASLDHDRRRSEMVQNDIRAVPHRVNRSILESPVIGWASHPSVQEITLGSGHIYDLPTTPESLRQWLRPMPTRALPP